MAHSAELLGHQLASCGDEATVLWLRFVFFTPFSASLDQQWPMKTVFLPVVWPDRKQRSNPPPGPEHQGVLLHTSPPDVPRRRSFGLLRLDRSGQGFHSDSAQRISCSACLSAASALKINAGLHTQPWPHCKWKTTRPSVDAAKAFQPMEAEWRRFVL